MTDELFIPAGMFWNAVFAVGERRERFISDLDPMFDLREEPLTRQAITKVLADKGRLALGAEEGEDYDFTYVMGEDYVVVQLTHHSFRQMAVLP